jgi:dTDP-4-dehydrorhamnose reductase
MAAAVMRGCEGEVGGLAEAVKRVGGVYHAAGAGETTWYGFAAEALRMERAREPGTRLAEIEAITTSEYPTPAQRPANSRLNCKKLAEQFGWRMMDWQESLRRVLSEV